MAWLDWAPPRAKAQAPRATRPAGCCRRFRWREATTLADHGSRVRWTPGRARRADGAAASGAAGTRRGGRGRHGGARERQDPPPGGGLAPTRWPALHADRRLRAGSERAAGRGRRPAARARGPGSRAWRGREDWRWLRAESD